MGEQPYLGRVQELERTWSIQDIKVLHGPGYPRPPYGGEGACMPLLIHLVADGARAVSMVVAGLHSMSHRAVSLHGGWHDCEHPSRA